MPRRLSCQYVNVTFGETAGCLFGVQLGHRVIFNLPTERHHYADDLDRKGLNLGGRVALWGISSIEGPRLRPLVFNPAQ